MSDFGRILSRPLVAAVAVVALAAGVQSPPSPAASPAPSPVPSPQRLTAATIVTERPDAESARIAAQAQGSRVEVSSMRDAYSQTFVNPDGTVTTESSTTPVRVARDGGWVPVDYTLKHVDGGWRPAASPVDVVFSDGGDKDAVSLGAGSKQVNLSWAVTLPAPVIDRATATYDLGGGESLILTATAKGFEQSLRLATVPTTLPQMRLPFDTSGLTMQASSAGGYDFVDASGAVVYSMPAPLIYGADYDPEALDPTQFRPLATALVDTANGPRLDLTPSMAWLTDPSLKYPVTIDPTISAVTGVGDTWIQDNLSTNQSSNAATAVGWNSGHAARTLFQVGGLAGLYGKHILSSVLTLYNYSSATCTPALIHAYPLTTGFTMSTVTWATRPSYTTVNYGAGSFASGATGCAAGFQTVEMTNLTQAWANRSIAEYGFQLSGTESSGGQEWSFCTMDPVSDTSKVCSSTARSPKLSVTYNSFPKTPTNLGVTPCAATCNSNALTNTTTPKLAANTSDPDGGMLQNDYAIYQGSGTPTGSPLLWAHVSNVPAGTTSYLTVPAGTLADGQTYQYKAVGDDGTDLGPYSGYTKFTVDTTAPATPTVSSSAYPAGAWQTTNAAGSFTFTDTAIDLASWEYSWDGGTTWSAVTATTNTVTTTLTPQPGLNHLIVRALDKAGNRSAASSTYSFGAGASLSTPADQTRTQKYTALAAQGPPSTTAVRFQYRVGTGSWTDIPAGDVTQSGTALSSWPVATDTTTDPNVASAPTGLVWNAAATLANNDQSVAVQAVFTSGGTNYPTANPVQLILDQQAFGGSDATTTVGPAQVSLMTGNAQIAATDANLTSTGASLTVSRAFNSFTPATAGIFGPGWVASTPVDSAGMDWAKFEDLGSTVRLTDSSGGLSFFTKTSSGYSGVDDLEGYTLVKGSGTFTMTDLDGNTVYFGQPTGGTASPSTPVTYTVQRVQQPGSANSSSFVYNTDNTPFAMIAPAPTGVTCPATITPDQPAGCRVLFFHYALVAGNSQVTAITLHTASGSGTAQSVDVACYAYDSTSGRLTSAWDPRITGTICAAAPTAADLPTTYGYDATSGRITTITPPGLQGWTLAYNTGIGPATLASVTRTHTSGADEKTSIRYQVPIGATTTSDTTHPDLSPTAVATWGQTDLPLTATVVYPPGSAVSSTDLRDGDVHAMDLNGREVNTASFSGTDQTGWKINTTEYDTNGNTVRSLTAGDREFALNPNTDQLTALGLAGLTSPQISHALDTQTFYTADGLDQTDTFGPLHLTVLSTGTTPARAHSHTSYGTVDYPATTPSDWVTQAPLHQAQTVTTAASPSPDPFGADDVDVRTHITAYALSSTDHAGWDLLAPMSQTTVMSGGTNIVKITRYDPTTGAVTEQRQPSATSKDDPGTRVTTYYGAGTYDLANCQNAAWYGQVCSTGPTTPGQPTTASLPGLPVTTTTYDALLRPISTTDTVTPAGGGTAVTRTTTTTYRSTYSPQIQSTATTGGAGTPLPATTTTYDPSNTGLTATTSDGVHTITYSYDDFGREKARVTTDSSLGTPGNVDKTTTSYDANGNIDTVTNLGSDLSTVIGSTTNHYNGGTEHRGLLTSQTITGLGTLTGSYNADGTLTTQTYPNGSGGTAMTETWTIDPTGDTTAVDYAQGSTDWMSDTQISNAQGQWAHETAGADAPFTSRDYSYDPAGRLTKVAEQGTPGDSTGCVTRTYAYTGNAGLNSNRTARAAYPADSNGACSTIPNTALASQAQTFTYDSADRLLSTDTATGITYDTFGRTTTLPSATGNGTGDITAGYYTDDTIRTLQQTTGSTTTTQTYYLDALGRTACRHDQTSGTTPSTCATSAGDTANHYGNDQYSPDWTANTPTSGGTTTTHWYGTGLDGNLAIDLTTTGSTTTATYQLAGLHGDIWLTTSQDASSSPDGAAVYADEYGNTSSGTQQYAWLGGKQRAAQGLAQLVTMGARIYAPNVGRFTSVDSVYGGNPNAYIYPDDPINGFDLNGQCWICSVWHHVTHFVRKHWADIALTAASFIPVAGEAAWAIRGAEWADRLAESKWVGTSSRLFGRARMGRKGLLNRGAVRVGWGWNGSRNVFRIGLGWARRMQTNQFKRWVGHRHWDLF